LKIKLNSYKIIIKNWSINFTLPNHIRFRLSAASSLKKGGFTLQSGLEKLRCFNYINEKVTQTPIEKIGAQKKNAHESHRGFLG